MKKLTLSLLVLFALLASSRAAELFPTNSTWRYLKGTAEASSPDINAWKTVGFNDAAWSTGQAPFYYDTDTNPSTAFTGNTQLPDMNGGYSSIFMRRTFVITNLEEVVQLKMDVNCDDGYVISINGVEFARNNVPAGQLRYTNVASAAVEPATYLNYTTNYPTNMLVLGPNVVSVMAFNSALSGSTDFTIDLRMSTVVPDAVPPVVQNFLPPAGTVTSLTQVSVNFSEPMLNVEAADLLVNGVPATGISGSSSSSYTFTFPQPAYGNVQITWAGGHGITDQGFPTPNPFNGTAPGSTIQYTLVDQTAPTVTAYNPLQFVTVISLSQIDITFSEPVIGVNAGDLLINGSPAASVTPLPGNKYSFQFPAVAPGTINVAWAGGHGITDLATSPNGFAGGSWTYTVDPNATLGGVVISEFNAANTSGLRDEYNEQEDWIELFNTTSNTVSLAGWSLTDEKGNDSKWVFPPVSIMPMSYLVVFASGRDTNRPPGTNLHTNFKISNNTGYLALFNSQSPRQLMTAFDPYPRQRANFSYGPDANGNIRYFQTPTPRAANGVSTISNLVGQVHFSVNRGFYNAPFTLAITCDDPSATIRYTLDGTTPTSTVGTVYTGPLQVTNTSTIRASAFITGYLAADVVTHTYIFVADVAKQKDETPPSPAWPAQKKSGAGQQYDYGMDPNIVNQPSVAATIQDDLKSLPSYSIVTDLNNLFGGSGIYSNPSGDTIAWERPASIELLTPDGDGGFQINGGIRIRGGFSRSTDNPKHALRLFFRQDYGDGKLEHNSFPYPDFGPKASTEFDKYDLRTWQNYSWSFQNDSRQMGVRDVFSRDAQLKMGQASSHGDFFHLYINGQYWGIYNTDERPEANFGAHYYGGDADNYDTIKVAPDDGYIIYATDGNFTAWSNLWFQAQSGLTTDAAYEKVQGNNPDGTRNPAYENLIDVDNLIDYMLVIYYGGNLDAPISNFLGNNSPNNWFGFRDRSGTNGGFRFVAHDSEHTLLNANEDRTGPYTAGAPSNGGVLKSSPQYVFQQMWGNPELRIRAADHIQRAFFNGGALSPQGAAELLMVRSNQLFRAMNAEAARWGDAKREPPYNRNDWINAFNTVMTTFVPQRTAVVLNQLKSKGLYPTNNAPIFSQFGGLVPGGYSLSISNPNPNGTIFYTLDGSDPRKRGGAVSPTAISYAGPIVLNNTVTVRARVLTAGNTWSALVEAKFFVSQDFTKLIVSELMYNPPRFGTNDGDLYEFLELKNVGTNSLDLSGLSFSGITFTFTNGTLLPPGQFFVLARNRTTILDKYPGLVVNGVFGGGLNNDGERLAINHPLGTPVLSFTFADSAPWPVAPDGLGFSLVPRNPNSHNPDDFASWRASALAGGSPGMDDPTPEIPVVYINEVLNNSASSPVDLVELYNPNGFGVSVGGWFLTDNNGSPKKYRFPNSAMIPAFGYLVVDENQFGTNALGTNGFAFSSSGEQVYLFSGDANTNLTGYSHGFAFNAADPDVTFGRYVNSVGVEQFPAQIAPTFGLTNSGPRVGPLVINEVNYHPGFGFDEFIEIYNVTENDVPLYDPVNPANTWRISGINYVFPQDAVVPAHGFVVVAGISPVDFRAKYNVPAAVPVLGPFIGLLQDGGESLELRKPEVPRGTNAIQFITVDAVRYNDKAPWPVSADGAGPSLQRLNPAVYGNDPINWFASGITPGRTNVFNNAPTVAISSPLNNSQIVIPSTVVLQAEASDTDGSILRVEYFQNGTKIGESDVPPYSVVASNLSEGSFTFTARAIDNGFSVTESAAVTINVTFPVAGNGIGLLGEYFSNNGTLNANFNLPATLVVTNPTINFNWGTGAPYPSISADNFSARWTGVVQPRYTDTYIFYPTSDDGTRVYINNVLVGNNWFDQGATERPSSPVYMVAGQNYLIKVEYEENGGDANAVLRWSAPYLPKDIVPASQLYPYGLPVIVNQFTNQLYAAVGSSFVLSSPLLGASPFNVDWFFNGAPYASFANIGTNGTTSITIPNMQMANAGNYYFVVSNAYGYVTSLVANVTVGTPAAITSPLVSQTVVEGTDVGFSVGVSGTPPYTYVWTRGTFPAGNFLTNVTSFPNDAIVIPSVSYTNNGASYRVTVSNPYGATVTSSAQLNVMFAPKLVSQPTNLFLAVGTNTTITATASANPAGSYFWYFNETNLVLLGTNRLTVSNIQPAQAGSYSVIVSNSQGSVTGLIANVTVGFGPVITTQPGPVYTVLAGEDAVFSMTATGSFPMVARVLRSNVQKTIATMEDSELTVTYPNVQPTDAGTLWQIRLTNMFNRTGVTSSNFTLNVVYPPTFIRQPANATVAFGGTTNFLATASGNPAPSYQWYFNGTNLIAGATNTFQVTNAFLGITNAQAADSGLYSVVASNIYGMATSSVAVLNLPLPPQILVQPVNTVTAAGSNVIFRVVASGNATLRYQWRFNGTNILGALSANYLLANPQAGVHEGIYTVVVSNTLGVVISEPATLVIDSDSDGLPDTYENDYGLGSNNPADGSQDADHDGMSNYHEYLAGTNPTNALSVLKIETDANSTGGDVLRFLAVSNKSYSLLFRGNVNAGPWAGLTNIIAVPADRTVIVTNNPGGAGQRFYRLVTPQLP